MARFTLTKDEVEALLAMIRYWRALGQPLLDTTLGHTISIIRIESAELKLLQGDS